MAIDTTEKKLSLMDFEEIAASALPLPSGSLDQGDNQHGLWSYSGLLWGAYVPPVVTDPGDATITASVFSRHLFPPHDSNFGRSGFGFWRLRLPSVRGLSPSGV